VISLTFELPEGNGRIQAECEVAWTRDSGHLTGVRFLDVGEDSRRQLELWLSSQVATASSSAPIPPPEPDHQASSGASDPPLQALQPEEPVANHQEEAAPPRQLGNLVNLEERPGHEMPGPVLAGTPSPNSFLRYPVRIFVAVILLSWAFIFLGYRMGSTEMNAPVKEATVSVSAAEANSLPSPGPSDQASPPQASLHPVALSDPGLVLQVGAMKKESNADSLAAALQKKNFPAFVFQRGRGQLYRVGVGPYSGAQTASAFKVKDDLRKQGFTAIVKHWLPE